jgi:hypothetical protein
MVVIVFIHKVLAKLSIYNKTFGAAVKGKKVLLYHEGKFLRRKYGTA